MSYLMVSVILSIRTKTNTLDNSLKEKNLVKEIISLVRVLFLVDCGNRMLRFKDN